MRLFVLFSLALCLAGCGNSAQEQYQDYLDRLASVLGDAPRLPKSTSLMTPHISKPDSTFSLSILQLAKINHCQLNQTIAKRNNQLGKLQTPSESFKYHVRFIQEADACIQHPGTASDIAEILQQASLAKQQSLHSEFVYMVFNEPELKKLLQLTSRSLPIDTNQYSMSSSFESLDYFAALVKQIENKEFNNIDITPLTLQLQKLNQSERIVQLLTSARQQILFNNAATQWLNEFNVETDLCPATKNKQKAQILNSVFSKFFLSGIQGYQADLTGHLEKISPKLMAIWSHDNELKRLFDVSNPTSLIGQLKLSSKTHVQWWQAFYKTCKISPV